jgi:AAA domain
MSGTRTAKDDGVFHQSKFASSEGFERGLIANLVAKRAALLEDKADRELIWFIQYMSHQEGGIAALAKDITAKFPDRVQTIHMAELKLKPGKTCTRDEVKAIRQDFPDDYNYLLKGEDAVGILYRQMDGSIRPDPYPNSYPASVFFSRCETEAVKNLHNELSEICLNPERDINAGKPWYFPTLIQTLREYQANFIQQKSEGVAVTSLGAKVFEVLDFTFYSRGLSLMEGEARLGKSFAAKAWCSQNPGRARFVEVPPGNDEIGFFQALARGLGLGNFLNYKASQIRQRVESVLLTGDLLLVLDEAQRLWPLNDLRRGHPNRIVWAMAMANARVPICCVSTPQFIQAQISLTKSGWNSAQLTGRIAHYESLPAELSEQDLMAVAKSVLPNMPEKIHRHLATYASTSARYLAAIDSVATRARYLAMRAARKETAPDDVRRAMNESVIGSDTRLNQAMASVEKPITSGPTAPVLMDVARTDDGADEPITIARGNLSAPGSRISNEFLPAVAAD